MKIDLSTYTTGGYHPKSPLWKQVLWYYVNSLVFNTYWFPFSGLKVFLLRLFGAKVGEGVNIKPAVNIKYPWRLTIGNHTWIGEQVWIDNLKDVTIGSHVCISQGALLLCGNHDYTDPHFGLMAKEIHLADGVWVGARATVCPNVTLEEGAVLSVGSVANKDIPAYQIYAGVPATFRRERRVKERSAFVCSTPPLTAQSN